VLPKELIDRLLLREEQKEPDIKVWGSPAFFE
jgi:hypothetical protein